MILEDKNFILYGRPLIFMRDTTVPNSLASVWHVIVSVKLLFSGLELSLCWVVSFHFTLSSPELADFILRKSIHEENSCFF